MMNKFYLFLFLLLYATAGMTAEKKNAVIFWYTNGEKHTYLLNTNPELTFSGEDIVITANGTSLTYKGTSIEGVSFEKVDDTAIDAVISDSQQSIMMDNEMIKCMMLPAYSIVEIVTADGRTIISGKADFNGCFSVETSSIGSGLYIIKTKRGNLKIRK